MTKLTFLLLTIIATSACLAQKSRFIDHVGISFTLGGDNYRVDKDKWKNVAKDPNGVANYNMDSFHYQTTQVICGIRLPSFDRGVRIQVGKDLLTKQEHRLLYRKLLVTAGLAYIQNKYKHDGLLSNNLNFPLDSTRTYSGQQLYFTQQKHTLELNQAISYRFNALFIRNVEYSIGVGYLLRSELKNSIVEQHTQTQTAYNPTLHQFQTTTVAQSEKKIDGKNFTTFQLFVPLGLNLRLAPSSDISFELGYSYSRNRFTDVYKKNEAWRFQLGYTYNFSD